MHDDPSATPAAAYSSVILSQVGNRPRNNHCGANPAYSFSPIICLSRERGWVASRPAIVMHGSVGFRIQLEYSIDLRKIPAFAVALP
jgi:hypothetical protein